MAKTELEKNFDLLLDLYSKKSSTIPTGKVENSLITILEEEAETKYQQDKEDPDNYYGSGEDPEYLKKAALDIIKQAIQYCAKNSKATV